MGRFGTQFETTIRLETIFEAILKKESAYSSFKEVSDLRKVAIWALCLIILTPKKSLSNFSESLRKQLEFFKDEIENKNPFGGKIQLNPIPEIVKRMIKKDSNVITRMKADGYHMSFDQRIWAFPRYE